MESVDGKRRAMWLAASIALLALALVKFGYEDRVGFDYPVNDLISPWVSAKAFVHGKNPFSDSAEFARIWAGVESSPPAEYRDFAAILKRNPMIYPPSALPVIALLTLLPWKAAIAANLLVSMAVFLAWLWMLAESLPMPSGDPRKLFLVAFGLAMIPLNSAIRESNLSTLAAACAGIGVLQMIKRPYLAGVALAVGLCLKPQIAFLLFAYPWLRGKWKAGLTGVGVSGALFAGSLLWMRAHGVDGMRSFLETVSTLSAADSDTSFYKPGPGKFTMVNVQVLAFQWTGSQAISQVIAWGLFLVLAIVSVYLIRTRVSESNEASGIAIVPVLTLLPIYQRIYNETILIFVLCWALAVWPARKGKAALLLLLPLLIPIVGITQKGVAGAFVRRHNLWAGFAWNAILMPHLIWINIFLAFILIASLYRTIVPGPAELKAGPGALA